MTSTVLLVHLMGPVALAAGLAALAPFVRGGRLRADRATPTAALPSAVGLVALGFAGVLLTLAGACWSLFDLIFGVLLSAR